MILVISSTGDEHAQAVMGILSREGTPAHIVDLSAFPERMSIALRYGASSGDGFCLSLPDGADVALSDVSAVWWRRPQLFGLDPAMRRPSHRAFAYNESDEAFAGLWQAMDVFWVNHPTRDAVAARKAYQLRVAHDVGLTVPDTLITNDPVAAAAFSEHHAPGPVIYKSFSATAREWRETRILGAEDAALLETVQHAPVIFQEYVPADVDLRITVVGEAIFPAAIHSQETAYPVDFRIDMGAAHVESAELPHDVRTGVERLMKALGLVYGAIDMRRTPEGEHVFLEINPAGQWLFVEGRTGQRITEAVAGTLAAAARNG